MFYPLKDIQSSHKLYRFLFYLTKFISEIYRNLEAPQPLESQAYLITATPDNSAESVPKNWEWVSERSTVYIFLDIGLWTQSLTRVGNVPNCNFRKQKNVTNLFTGNLALSDLLLTVVVLPQEVHIFSQSDEFYEGMDLFCLSNNLHKGRFQKIHFFPSNSRWIM